jgi:hypothetical protein
MRLSLWSGVRFPSRPAKQRQRGEIVKFVVTLANGEDGYVVAECSGLPGCFSQGKTREEAIENKGTQPADHS